ncbi:MAG: CRISPR-associated endonuclease Cas3'', partial [Acetanaerobacterium sp.]
MYIGHKREEDGAEQPLSEHLLETARLAEQFAHAFGADAHAYRAGLLHDGGKYSAAFQRRIRGGPKCDHSTAGAREADKLGPPGRLLAYCIAGHHTGLQNAGCASDTGAEATLAARLKKDLPAYDALFSELDAQAFSPLPRIPVKPMGKGGFSLSFYIRMLYSCLVDADFLDTERFMQDGCVDRSTCYDFPTFLGKLNTHMAGFTADGLINQKRAEILDCCKRSAHLDRGLFTLTVPTGGGKTLSSLAFAIDHLLKHGMNRIIYVIPYTSIIEQNARVFEGLLGEENVLQHHSNFDFNDDEHEIKNKLKLSSENWDIPLVVTTNVQFFESLFANKSSRCRKLHSMANSVIILDEAQMLPVNYLIPCVRALCELAHNYNSSVVLCSATQPALNAILPKGIVPREIC